MYLLVILKYMMGKKIIAIPKVTINNNKNIKYKISQNSLK
jgi:hypothetical protein